MDKVTGPCPQTTTFWESKEQDTYTKVHPPHNVSELRSCVNREVGLDSHSLPHPVFPSVPHEPCGFCGRKAP